MVPGLLSCTACILVDHPMVQRRKRATATVLRHRGAGDGQWGIQYDGRTIVLPSHCPRGRSYRPGCPPPI